jgi:hypothetical protein
MIIQRSISNVPGRLSPIILPSRFDPLQEAHISVSATETVEPPCHIVIVAATSHSALWFRFPVEGASLGWIVTKFGRQCSISVYGDE